jgi:hypothetical protein
MQNSQIRGDIAAGIGYQSRASEKGPPTGQTEDEQQVQVAGGRHFPALAPKGAAILGGFARGGGSGKDREQRARQAKARLALFVWSPAL